MSFNAPESSIHSGEPVNLFRFEFGGDIGVVYRYTDAEKAIEFANEVYEPITVRRGNINYSGTVDKSSLEVEVPLDADISEVFRIYPPSNVVALIVYQGHLVNGVPDNDFLVTWSGRVLSCKREDLSTTLLCESIYTSLQRTGLRRSYQYGCPHALYGPSCRAAKVARPLTVVTATGNNIVVASIDSILGAELADFVNGTVSWAAESGRKEVRNVHAIVPDGDNIRLTLSGSTPGLAVAAALSMYLGCRHTMADCNDLHNNILNFGGQPWIPLKNPIGLVSPFV